MNCELYVQLSHRFKIIQNCGISGQNAIVIIFIVTLILHVNVASQT